MTILLISSVLGFIALLLGGCLWVLGIVAKHADQRQAEWDAEKRLLILTVEHDRPERPVPPRFIHRSERTHKRWDGMGRSRRAEHR